MGLWLPTDNHFETLSSEFLDKMVVRIWFVLKLITFHPATSDVQFTSSSSSLLGFLHFIVFFLILVTPFHVTIPCPSRFQKLNLFRPLVIG